MIGDNQAAKLRGIASGLDAIDAQKATLGEQARDIYAQVKELTGVTPKAFRAARAAIKRENDADPELADEIAMIRMVLMPPREAADQMLEEKFPDGPTIPPGNGLRFLADLELPPHLDRRPKPPPAEPRRPRPAARRRVVAVRKQTFVGLPTEKQFQATVVAYAELHGWLVYHPYDSRRSAQGFPDLTMVRDGRLIFAELKRTEKDKPTDAQKRWLRELGDACPAYVWRPADWPEIERVLR